MVMMIKALLNSFLDVVVSLGDASVQDDCDVAAD